MGLYYQGIQKYKNTHSGIDIDTANTTLAKIILPDDKHHTLRGKMHKTYKLLPD